MQLPTLLALVATLPLLRAIEIDVTIGGPGVLKFNPEFVNASVGDQIVFHFLQKNHTVTQSSLQSPCVPLDQGFDSGFVPVNDSVTSDFPIAKLDITDTRPIWAFCKQANHCQSGMVFAVNPGDNFDPFKAAATGAANSSSTIVSSSSATVSSSATGVVTVTATVTVSATNAITTTYGSYPGSAAPTSAASSDHKIIVGGTGGVQTFSPSNITAQPGDTVTFEFHQKNHTVTQSSFGQPCQALTATSTTGAIGFDSGFMFVADDATTFPTYTIRINDTTPIWAFCQQQGHCANGMVFSVNAIESGPNNFSAFQARAKTLGSAPSGASTRSVHGAGIIVAMVAVVFGTLL